MGRAGYPSATQAIKVRCSLDAAFVWRVIASSKQERLKSDMRDRTKSRSPPGFRPHISSCASSSRRARRKSRPKVKPLAENLILANHSLAELLQRPFSRMSGHVVVEDTTASDLHPHEYVQVSKSGCDHDEKVTGHDDLGMVVDEGQPARFRIRRTYWATVSQVLLHGARGNPDPELQLQFVGDAFLAPSGVLRRHFSD